MTPVSVAASQRHAAFQLNMVGHIRVFHGRHAPRSPSGRELNRRNPRSQKIRAKRHNHLGLIKFEMRQHTRAVGLLMRVKNRRGTDGVKRYMFRVVERVEKRSYHGLKRGAGHRWRHKTDRAAAACDNAELLADRVRNEMVGDATIQPLRR